MNQNLQDLLFDINLANKYVENIKISKDYEKALVVIKSLNFGKNVRRDVHKIQGVKKYILDHIKDYFENGEKLRNEMIEIRNSENFGIYKKFISFAGVGDATAKKWISDNYKNIEEIKDAVDLGKLKLTTFQYYGIKYHEYMSKITRKKVFQLIKQLEPCLINLNFTVAGSFRREAKKVGDVDVIVYGKLSMKNLSKKIEKNEWFVGFFANGESRISYLHKIGKKIIQVDILHCKKEDYGTNLLYFTGSWAFNLSMRSWAKKNGYKLNQHGLYKLKKSSPEYSKIKINKEKDVFDELGLEWKEPKKRINQNDVVPIMN